MFKLILKCIILLDYDGASHPLHTHSRYISYIYKVFQHLQLWLVVIRMQPKLICLVSQSQRQQSEIVLVLDLNHAVGYD
jgi:hypothetical protein